MSSDNRICIMHWMSQWHVWHGSGSINYSEPPCTTKAFDTEKYALQYAAKLEEEISYLEYGCGPICVEEQIAGLNDVIESAKWRLDNLRKTGVQFPVYE